MKEARNVDFNEPAASLETVAAGRVLDAEMSAEGARLVAFAGQSVPDDGLNVFPPCGGVLTVWPDGRFVFASEADGAADAGRDEVGVYYPYALEDVDGSLVVGSFSMHDAGQAVERVDGFQAWSVADVLDMDSSLSIAGLGETHEGGTWSGASTADGLNWDHGGDAHDGASVGSEVLEHMLKTAHER